MVHPTHHPFAVVVRVRNLENPPSDHAADLPGTRQLADDRTRGWSSTSTSSRSRVGRSVVYRPDTEFAVVKKPAETHPQTVLDGSNDPNDRTTATAAPLPLPLVTP